MQPKLLTNASGWGNAFPGKIPNVPCTHPISTLLFWVSFHNCSQGLKMDLTYSKDTEWRAHKLFMQRTYNAAETCSFSVNTLPITSLVRKVSSAICSKYSKYIPQDQHTDAICSLNYNASANMYVTGSKDGSIKLWMAFLTSLSWFCISIPNIFQVKSMKHQPHL